MTKLNSLDDAVDLEILNIEEVARNSGKYKIYEKWFLAEKELQESGKAESLSEYLLVEYHIKNRSTSDLGEEFSVAAVTMKFLLMRLGIPIKNYSEASKGRILSQEHKNKVSASRTGKKYGPLSEKHKKKISESKKGKKLSVETRRRLSEYWKGKLNGENNPNYGNHLSDEAKQRISIARSKPLSAEHRAAISKGLMKLPSEIRKRGGLASIERFRKNSYYIEGRFYAPSQQEGVVALLLEKYVYGYNINDKVNYQIRGNGISNGGIDFLVDNEFLEWHPIVLMAKKKGHGTRGDIISEKEYESYKRVLKQLAEDEKNGFNEDYKKVLGINYRYSRQEGVDNSEYSGIPLTLVTDTKELYDFISRHSNSLPNQKYFNREFNQLIKYVKGFKVEPKEKAMGVAV